MEPHVQRAITAFQAGQPVCLFDSEKREGETDLLFPAAAAVPATMRQLRQDCGGLLFLAIGDEVGACFGLPFLQDLHTTEDAVQRNPVLSHLITNDLRYDARSAFTLSLNHRDTYTGITDHDRALTTRRFAELATACMAAGESGETAMKRLGEEFRTPGHIPVCREAKGASASAKVTPNSLLALLDLRARPRWSSEPRCFSRMATLRFPWPMLVPGQKTTAFHSSKERTWWPPWVAEHDRHPHEASA